MKVYLKKITSVLLVMALALSLAQVVAPKAEAATKKAVLLKGESTTISVFGGKIKSVKSSKSSVVKAKKKSDYSVTVSAKKKGKATITIKNVYGKSIKYAITVKNLTVNASKQSIQVTPTYSGYSSLVGFKVVNKTGVYLSTATLEYELYNGSDVIKTGNFYLSNIGAGETQYKVVSYTYEALAVTDAKAKLVGHSRSLAYKYTKQSSKVNATLKQGSIEEGSLVFTIKNTTKKDVTGYIYVLFYDQDGNLIGVSERYSSLKSKGVDTVTVSVPQGVATYKVNKSYYSKVYQSI